MGNDEMMRMGFLTGIIVGCVLLLLFIRLSKRSGSGKCSFDERQQIVRGRGFKYGFFAWLIFDAVCIVTDIGLEERFMDLSLTLLSGMLIGLAVYASYCIWNDGYISLNQSPKRIMIILAAGGILNLVCAAYRFQQGMLENGKLTFLNGSNLFVAVTALFLLAVFIAKRCADRRDTE